MEEAPENGKDSSHSAHTNGMNEYIKVHNREEWKKILRMARNRHILHMPME
jgi:erythromycin esterase-like protein